MHNVGIDVGYNAVKAVDGATGRKIKFPSVVSIYEQVAISQAAHTDRDIVAHNGSRWYVGEDALDMSSKPYRRDTRDYAFMPEWKALLYAALGKLALPNYAAVSLVTGLPVDYYDDAQALRATLLGEHKFEWKGKSITVDVVRATVTYQFYGSAMSQLNSENAKRITDPHGVAIADGGGRTWNFGVLNQFDVVPGTTFTLDVGTWRRAVDVLRPQLMTEFRREFNDMELMSALETGQVWHERALHDITATQTAVLQPVAQEVIRIINDKWEQHLMKVSGIFFTGGSPLLLRPWLEEAYPYAWFGTEFDNAAGYAWYAGQNAGG